MKYRCYFTLCAAAALAPFAARDDLAPKPASPPWPAAYDGAPLSPWRLSAAEEKFHASFPGSVARFTDGRREFIFRWITAGTRKLHSGADCFRGLGYAVTPVPPERDSRGERWSCFFATKGIHHLRVRERITSGNEASSWTDVSAWYWSTVLHPSEGPWLATTIAEPAP